MFFKSETKTEVVEKAAMFGNPSVYVEVNTPVKTIYGTTAITTQAMFKLVSDILKSVIDTDKTANVSIGIAYDGITKVFVNGAIGYEDIDKGKLVGVDTVSALVSTMINQLLNMFFEKYANDRKGSMA